jgi:Domain of unknown function (DUF4136)
MNPLPTGLLVLASTLVLVACAPRVTIDFDKGADFSRYRTYAWTQGTPVKNPLMDHRIIAAIDDQLAAKAIRKTEDNPNMSVSYHYAFSEETRDYTSSTGVGYGPNWGPGYSWYDWWGSTGTTYTSSMKVPIGTLNVDIYDTTNNQMIWRGSGSDIISRNPEKSSEQIKEAVEAMFKKFPPR